MSRWIPTRARSAPAIALPTYNPNVPGRRALLRLGHSQSAADRHRAPPTLDPTLAIPSQVSAQLNLQRDGRASTYYYNTSQFIPGDRPARSPLQVGTPRPANRGATPIRSRPATSRGTTTTTTATGSTDVINDSGSALGGGAGSVGWPGEGDLGDRGRDPRPWARGWQEPVVRHRDRARPTPTRPASSRRWSYNSGPGNLHPHAHRRHQDSSSIRRAGRSPTSTPTAWRSPTPYDGSGRPGHDSQDHYGQHDDLRL